ncbi:hypothetical protein GWP57_07770 [Gammaproteobacteria bacterium]|jgi:hypothetical protein|nr:hypothetical protein [Gammaproteobacteria bacterium]
MTVEWFGLSRITARRRLKLARASKGVFGCIVFFSLSVAACSTKNDEFKWTAGVLIPNSFGMADGTWRDVSVSECVSRCAADQLCRGFSIEAIYGNDWHDGCKGGLCQVKTECHAKSDYGDAAYWRPDDKIIHVPSVDPSSNQWITQWGTLEKAE